MFKPEQVPLSNITDAWKVRCGCLYVFVKMPDNVTRTTFIPMPKTDREKCGSTHPDSTDRLFVPFQLTKEA